MTPAPFNPAQLRPGATYPVNPKSKGRGIALEIVPGLFGVFGIGNIYAGRLALGVGLMVSFWVLFGINFALIFLGIGFVTMPLTWIAYLVAGPLLAARGIDQYNGVRR